MNLSFNELQEEEAKLSAKKIQQEKVMQEVRAGRLPSDNTRINRIWKTSTPTNEIIHRNPCIICTCK
jgi:hypothetical protein